MTINQPMVLPRCPHCGGDKLALWKSDDDEKPQVWVSLLCCHCGASGPKFFPPDGKLYGGECDAERLLNEAATLWALRADRRVPVTAEEMDKKVKAFRDSQQKGAES